MARDSFSDMLINPNLRSLESPAPSRQGVALRRGSRVSVNALAVIAVSALVLAALLAYSLLQSSRQQAAQWRVLESQLAATNQSLKVVQGRLDGAEASLKSQLEGTRGRAGVTQREPKRARAR